jgi:hypothetical protein
MSSQRKTATAARPSRRIGGWADRAKAGDAEGLEPSGSHIPEQQRRLAELMGRWWEARDSGNLLPPNQQAELEALARIALRGSAPDESD